MHKKYWTKMLHETNESAAPSLSHTYTGRPPALPFSHPPAHPPNLPPSFSPSVGSGAAPRRGRPAMQSAINKRQLGRRPCGGAN